MLFFVCMILRGRWVWSNVRVAALYCMVLGGCTRVNVATAQLGYPHLLVGSELEKEQTISGNSMPEQSSYTGRRICVIPLTTQ